MIAQESNRRAVPRWPVLRRVRFRWSVAELPAQVKNCSALGAMLAVNAAPARGTLATIISGTRDVPVEVAWARDGFVGVKFIGADNLILV